MGMPKSYRHTHWQLSLLLSEGAHTDKRPDHEGKQKESAPPDQRYTSTNNELKVRQLEHVGLHNKRAQTKRTANHTASDLWPRTALIRCRTSGNEIPGMAEISQCRLGRPIHPSFTEKNAGTVRVHERQDLAVKSS